MNHLLQLCILHHKPANGEFLEEYLQSYQNNTIILNIKSERVELECLKLLEKYNADGFLVLKDDTILYEHYWNGFSEHQRHIWFSMTKSLVSSAFGILMEDHEIDLSASPAKYLEELNGSGFERHRPSARPDQGSRSRSRSA